MEVSQLGGSTLAARVQGLTQSHGHGWLTRLGRLDHNATTDAHFIARPVALASAGLWHGRHFQKMST
jgi:hypothetical protein